MKVNAQPVVTIGKVPQKEGSRKGGSHIWPIWIVQLILEQLVNGTLLASISPNIASQFDMAMPGVKVIVQEIPIINFIWSCWTILRISGETLAYYCTGKVEQLD